MMGAMGLLAQGSLNFNSDLTASPNAPGVNVVFHIYSPDLTSPNTEFTGNSTIAWSTSSRNGDFPTGTQTYTGTLIGGSAVGSGPTGWANGNNYSVDLIAAAGDNKPVSSLVLVAGSTETFRTALATQAGFFTVPGAALQIPGTTYSGSGDLVDPTGATVAVQAWYSGGGAYPTYASAVGNTYNGQGLAFNVDSLGGGVITPPALYNGQSFSLVNPVPEPATIALGVMGACAFLARRRKS